MIKEFLGLLGLFIFVSVLSYVFFSTRLIEEAVPEKTVKKIEIVKKVEEEKLTGAQTPTPTTKPTAKLNQMSNYFLHQNIFATMFWVGEDSSDENDYIPNRSSAWDKDWMDNFGGIDNPYERNGYHPVSFKPKENPFYFALPYGEFAEIGKKANAVNIPWYQDIDPYASLLKNRWAKISFKGKTCYGQWEDVGPFEEDDDEYVFQNKRPKNTRAGIDLSPAMRTCLKMATNANVSWQFTDDADVPNGPWKEIISTSQTNW